MKLVISFTILLAVGAGPLGCTHTAKEIPLGTQDNHASYVPARIAVFNCQPWPTGARFKNLPLSNGSEEEFGNLCNQFNQFVLKGFEEQPYMRGLSPKAVEELLTRSNKVDLLNQLQPLWVHRSSDCGDCTNTVAFYTYSIAPRAEWQAWLTQLSRSAHNADAVLIPFITFATKSRFVDRGVAVARIQVGATMLLIDTNNGFLLWAGGRVAEANNRILEAKTSVEGVPFPAWEQVYERLFTNDLWREFPGRQEY